MIPARASSVYERECLTIRTQVLYELILDNPKLAENPFANSTSSSRTRVFSYINLYNHILYTLQRIHLQILAAGHTVSP